MTREQVRIAIQQGRATPGVPQALYEAVYLDIIKESHPDWDPKIILLQESRSSGGSPGLPDDVHQRVANMLAAAKGKQQTVTRLAESRSDRTDDRRLNPPQDADTASRLLKAAAARFRERDDPAAVAARAADHDRVDPSRAKPWIFKPAASLTEAKADAARLPEGIHGLVYARLRGA